jgi:hypothetical protein
MLKYSPQQVILRKFLFGIKRTNKIMKLHSFSQQADIPTEWPPIVGEVSANFSG